MKNLSLLTLLPLAFFMWQVASAQCNVSSVQTPDVASNNSFSGSDFDWDDANLALSSNNQYASAGFTLGLFATVQSDYMTLSDFDISIPLAVTICGIEVTIERKASGLGILGASVRDHVVQLVKNGSLVGNNKASSTNWTGSKVTTTYGGSSDLWGTTWTSADVNHNNFGLSFSAELRSGAAGLFLSADIDNVTITVYYQHVVLPGSVLSFTGTPKGNSVELAWSIKDEHNIKGFEVERQSVHSSWETVARLNVITPGKNEFAVYDLPQSKNNQYRLKIIDEKGGLSYSEIITVQSPDGPGDVCMTVDANNRTIVIRADEPIQFYKIVSLDGTRSTYVSTAVNNTIIAISPEDLPGGHIIVQAQAKGNKRHTQQFYLRK